MEFPTLQIDDVYERLNQNHKIERYISPNSERFYEFCDGLEEFVCTLNKFFVCDLELFCEFLIKILTNNSTIQNEVSEFFGFNDPEFPESEHTKISLVINIEALRNLYNSAYIGSSVVI